MLETQKLRRKPFDIDAVRVTEQNINDVAKWAAGEVRTTTDENGVALKYIKVRVHRPLNTRQTQAFVGDWVLYAGTGFKVYTHRALVKSFDPIDAGTTLQALPEPVEQPLPLEELKNMTTGERALAVQVTPASLARARKPSKVVE